MSVRLKNIQQIVSRWPVDCNDPGMSVDKVLLFLMYNIIMLSNDGLAVIEETKVSMLQVELVKFIDNILSNRLILGDVYFFYWAWGHMKEKKH